MTVGTLIQHGLAAKALLAYVSYSETRRGVFRRRLHRSGLLLWNVLPYAQFFAKLHLSRAGRVLYHHSHVFNRKFLGPYLSTDLATHKKLAVQKHFLFFVDRAFAGDTSIRGLRRGLCLWQRTAENEDHRIVLRLSDATKFEGDLLLEYLFNDQRLHSLSYVFAPGRVFGLPDANVAFIGGSQGANGCQQETRAAARGIGGIHPANMLVLALRAICQSLNVTGLCGVPSRFQLLNHTDQSPREENYDRLWTMNDGTLLNHVYYMPARLNVDDDGQLTGTHRTRRRRRRRLRQTIIDEIAACFRLYTMPGRETARITSSYRPSTI